MSSMMRFHDEFDVPSEANVTSILVSPLSPISSLRRGDLRPATPESPRSPITSPRMDVLAPQIAAASPARSYSENQALAFPSETSSRTAQRKQDEPAAEPTSPKREGAWDKLQRFTAGIAGIVPSKLGRRNSREEKEDVHGVAVDLLKLAFAVCAATPVDCLRCASAATALDRLALKRVLELAVLNGLLGPSTECFFDHIEAFLKGNRTSRTDTNLPHGQKLTRSPSSQSLRTSREKKLTRSPSSQSIGDQREHFRQKGRSFTNLSNFSNMSNMSALSRPSKETDFSATSFLDFNGKQRGLKQSFLDYINTRSNSSSQLPDPGQGLPIVMEFEMPSVPVNPPGRQQAVHFASQEDCHSEAETYHSMCDMVLVGGENGSKREPIRAEVLSFGHKGDGPTQMRIAFQSSCLKTQNEWQRHLLNQQRSLVDAMTTKLESAEEELQMRDDVMAEEKELLRSFRKIVTREIDLSHKSLTVEIFVVEKDAELSREIEELSDILEFPCSTFRSLTLAIEGMKSSQGIVQDYQRRRMLQRAPVGQESRPEPKTKSRAALKHMETGDILTLVGETGSSESSPRFPRSQTTKSNMSAAPLERLWRSEGERSFARSGTTKSSLSRVTEASFLSHHSCSSGSAYSAEPMYCRIIFVGSEWLYRDLPAEWLEGDATYLVLTSKPEKFEEIGRKLLAENKSEMLDRLSARGISDYVLQPLSLDGLRRLVNAALCKSFGHEYLLTTVIGRGAYGVVYRAKRLKDGKVFALKEINTKRMSKSAQADLEVETELLKHLRWPTLIEMVDAWFVQTLRYLLMPLLDRGTIENRLEECQANSKQLPLTEITEWYTQIIHGIVYLHHSGVIHRDVKPSNILLAAEGVLQIGDLGNAVNAPGPGPHPCKRMFVHGTVCTPCYAGPESVMLEVILFASDLWSVGASLYEMLTLQCLFPPKTAPIELKEMIEKFDFDSSMFFRDQKNIGSAALATLRSCPHGSANSTNFTELLSDVKQLLCRDPLQRPSAAALAARRQVQQPLWNVLSKLLPEPEEHFNLFEIFIAESREAEQTAPPSVDCTYPPAEKRLRRRPTKRNSLISALTKRDVS